MKHLTIECIDYTHALLKVIPRKYLKSFKSDLMGGTPPPESSSHVSRIFYCMPKFINLHYLMLPNIPNYIDSREVIISAMQTFQHIQELHISCNSINPVMLYNIFLNLNCNIKKIRFFNTYINKKCLDALNTCPCFKMLKILQFNLVADLQENFTTLLELLLGKVKTLEELSLMLNDLSMEQHTTLCNIYSHIENITILRIAEPELEFERGFQELLCKVDQIQNKFKLS